MKLNKFFSCVFMATSVFTSCNSAPKESVNLENEVQRSNRYLIINADDLCYDKATNDAIIKCFTEGIVTSTTAYVNFPDSIQLLKDAHEQCPDLPIGIHLNITLGKPVLPPEEIPTLVNKKTGEFWNEDQILTHIAKMSYEEVQKEIHAQIELFRSSGVPLDHIDYHNHLLALYTPYHQIVREEAVRLKVPVRNPVPISSYKKIKVSDGGGDSAAISKLIVYGMLHPFKSIPMMKKVGVPAFIEQEKITKEMGITTSDWFVDVFYENSTSETFLSIIEQLPEGVSEIMCHPGSSSKELDILTNVEVKAEVLKKGIILSNFKEHIKVKNRRETDYFVYNYDDKDLKLLEESEKALDDNLARLMQFFNLTELSQKITVDIYPTLEQWILFIESKGQQYQDFIVGVAEQNTISVLAFDQYTKTNMHKKDTFQHFLQVIVHECVHICNYERIENPNNSVSFVMEGLATYLANQDYNPNVKSDYNCGTMCNYQSFFTLKDPYSVAQILVRKMLETLSAEQVIEYSGNLEKLWKDWEKIFG